MSRIWTDVCGGCCCRSGIGKREGGEWLALRLKSYFLVVLSMTYTSLQSLFPKTSNVYTHTQFSDSVPSAILLVTHADQCSLAISSLEESGAEIGQQLPKHLLPHFDHHLPRQPAPAHQQRDHHHHPASQRPLEHRQQAPTAPLPQSRSCPWNQGSTK